MALSLALSCLLRGFLATIRILLVIKVLKNKGFVLKYVFEAKLYNFGLSTAYVLLSNMLPCITYMLLGNRSWTLHSSLQNFICVIVL